jgi:hypothetical protein
VSYQAEKFTLARRALMLPHPRGEAAAIADAFLELSLALHHYDETKLEEFASGRVRRLRELMDISDVKTGSEVGAWTHKAKGFGSEERQEVSRLVDELATWFGEHQRG